LLSQSKIKSKRIAIYFFALAFSFAFGQHWNKQSTKVSDKVVGLAWMGCLKTWTFSVKRYMDVLAKSRYHEASVPTQASPTALARIITPIVLFNF
jgi:hypothetical protein